MIYTLIAKILAYTPSIYDPKARDIRAELEQNIGFLSNHAKSVAGNHNFGDMSILSVNMWTKATSDMKDKNQRMQVTNLVNSHHPSILAIQACSTNQMRLFEQEFKDHYNVVGNKEFHTDLATLKREYRPIFVDKNMFDIIKEGKFAPKDKAEHPYASFVVLRSKTQKPQVFTVINADLYSGNSQYIEKQLYHMMKNFEDSPYKSNPLFLAGMVNEQTSAVKTLISDNNLANLINGDSNNGTLTKTTFHHNGALEDGKQRDFILLKDLNKTFKLNYARILSDMDKKHLLHYPIWTILSYNNN